jgi:hypothetical protein
MACGNGCGGYYACGCDILRMKEQVAQKKKEIELLQHRINARVEEFNRDNSGSGYTRMYPVKVESGGDIQ